jgi:hypothetical protein
LNPMYFENTGQLGGVAEDDIQRISMTLPKFPVCFEGCHPQIPAQMSGFGFQGTVVKCKKYQQKWPSLLSFARGKLRYTTKDVISKADDISTEVDNLTEAMENLEDLGEVCNVEKVKTILDEFEVEEFEEDKKALEDKVKGERFNVCDVKQVKGEQESLLLSIGLCIGSKLGV